VGEKIQKCRHKFFLLLFFIALIIINLLSGDAAKKRTMMMVEEKSEMEEARISWANSLRKVVTRSDAIESTDGSIRQQFFKPTKIVFETSGKKWGDAQKEKLYEGLRTFGVGEWAKMKEHFEKELGEWSTLDLRVKASRLLGSQSLSRYPKGWKGTKEEVDLEYQKHKEIGEKTGCWKSGTLVEDDDGSVAKLLKERELAGQ
jgi:hypothetical protein